MANNVVQLVDNDENNIFPVAGSMASDSIETNMLKDSCVTSQKIDCTTITLTNVTTSTYGNITTTLPKATTVPICANLNYINGFATFYTYPETNYWILHICQVGDGTALPNQSFNSIEVYYLGSI